LQDTVIAARPDILVTNELPFGEWLAEGAVFSEEAARPSAAPKAVFFQRAWMV
jgi:hypothetical protein